MESALQIGRPRKFLRKKKRVSDIQPDGSKFLKKAKLNNNQPFRLAKQQDPVKFVKKVFLKKKVKKTLLPPVKEFLDTPRKKIIFKKRNSIKATAVKVEDFPFDSKLKNLKRAPKFSKSTKEKLVMLGNVKSNFVKKSSRKSADKGNGTKVPGKGTLKRKRWICDQYIQENENHEDDMYEMKKFEHFRSLLGDDSDSSEKFDELKTPDFPFSLSPRQTTPSPTYKDCYDLAQLKKFRAKAEKSFYRRNKRMKNSHSEKITKAPKFEQQPVSTDDVTNKLEQVVKILNDCYTNNEKAIETANSENASESEEDQYYYDLQDNQNAVESIR